MANQGNNVIERIFGWEFIKWVSPTFWQSVGHITSDPLANWYPCSNPPSNPAPSLSLSLSFSLSLYSPSICTSCPEDVSCLHVWTVWGVYVFILLPGVTGHSVTSGGRAFRFPGWRDIPLPAVTGQGIIGLRGGCAWLLRHVRKRETWARHGWLSAHVCVR